MDAVWFIYNLSLPWVWIVIGFWVHCNIGYRFAEHKIYVAGNFTSHPWLYFYYWPAYGQVYKLQKCRPYLIEDSEKFYKFWMTLIWPVTVLWNTAFVLLIAFMFCLEFLLDKFISLLTWGRIKSLAD